MTDFASLAKRRGFTPKIRTRADADALEALDLIELTEDLGNRVLRLVSVNKLELDAANQLLDRLLACYIEPLRNGRAIAEIAAEVRTQEQ